MHPFKGQSDSSRKAKMSAMSSTSDPKLPNLDGNGTYKKVGTSGSAMQHKDQSAAPGMKRGGRLDKAKRGHKTKLPIAASVMDQAPPSPDLAGMQAGAGASPSPAPAPSPMMPPMQKRGGVVKRADGGRVKYPLKKGGSMTGDGRKEKAASYKKFGHKEG